MPVVAQWYDIRLKMRETVTGTSEPCLVQAVGLMYCFELY